MKQVLLRKGKISIGEVPAPALTPKSLLVEVTHSLISTGTELSTVRQSGASLLEKARTRPALWCSFKVSMNSPAGISGLSRCSI